MFELFPQDESSVLSHLDSPFSFDSIAKYACMLAMYSWSLKGREEFSLTVKSGLEADIFTPSVCFDPYNSEPA